jgi:coenzyme Q-binding protein COQ10
MTVAYTFLRESFTSRVTLDRSAMSIRADYIDGPFRHLENIWRFEPMDEDECLVRFSIDYEFRSRALGALVGAVFDRAFRRLAEAFEKRADVVYGRGRARVGS